MTQVLSMTITLMVAGLVASVLFQDGRAATLKANYGTPAIEQPASEPGSI